MGTGDSLRSLMEKPKTNNRIVWVCILLAGVVTGGVGVLGVRLRPYWVARYRGKGADLHAAALPLAPLVGAALDGANLRGANLRGANLAHASLGVDTSAPPRLPMAGGFRGPRGADLTGADLTGANLNGAWMGDVRLPGAVLRGAALAGANLKHSNLRGADLRGTNLTGAYYDAQTRWPAGFEPRQHGAVLIK
jgi:hypothetical protein